MVGDLGGLDVFAWVTTSYIIASSVTTPVYGKLSDLFGRKKIFIVAVVLFLIGSALSGAAQSMDQLIAFRTVQGIGAGGLFVSVLAIIGELFSPREGAKYFNLFGIVFALAALAGPAVGGVLTDLLSWHWVFLVNLPVGIAFLVLVATCLHLLAVLFVAAVAFSRQLGSAVGISLFASIFYNRLTAEIADRVPAGAPHGMDVDALSSHETLGRLTDSVRHAVEQAYAAALTPVFLTAVPVLVAGLPAALAMKNLPLRSWDDQGADATAEDGSAPAQER
ncbi:MFS transporter [Streptomyces sp. NPDC058818]|uniref:MFS transporter n=1 Tax=Streptomyces sp. NPDC058818 TaxID=3346640 RepID=UPI0036C5EAD2